MVPQPFSFLMNSRTRGALQQAPLVLQTFFPFPPMEAGVYLLAPRQNQRLYQLRLRNRERDYGLAPIIKQIFIFPKPATLALAPKTRFQLFLSKGRWM